MDIHKNARLTLIRRGQLVEQVLFHKLSLQAAATAFQVCPRTAAKWTRRYQLEGAPGLQDRSSRPLAHPVAPEKRWQSAWNNCGDSASPAFTLPSSPV
jgi:hypothetical protein